MCDCATELERKRREIENRSSLKSRSASRVSSCCSLVCSGGGGDDRGPGLLQAIMMFIRGQMSLSEVAQAAGFTGSTGNLGIVGGLVGGGALLAMLGMLFKPGRSQGSSWNFGFRRKPPKRNCTPKPVAGEGPPKIKKEQLKWPSEDEY